MAPQERGALLVLLELKKRELRNYAASDTLLACEIVRRNRAANLIEDMQKSISQDPVYFAGTYRTVEEAVDQYADTAPREKLF